MADLGKECESVIVTEATLQKALQDTIDISDNAVATEDTTVAQSSATPAVPIVVVDAGADTDIDADDVEEDPLKSVPHDDCMRLIATAAMALEGKQYHSSLKTHTKQAMRDMYSVYVKTLDVYAYGDCHELARDSKVEIDYVDTSSGSTLTLSLPSQMHTYNNTTKKCEPSPEFSSFMAACGRFSNEFTNISNCCIEYIKYLPLQSFYFFPLILFIPRYRMKTSRPSVMEALLLSTPV